MVCVFPFVCFEHDVVCLQALLCCNFFSVVACTMVQATTEKNKIMKLIVDTVNCGLGILNMQVKNPKTTIHSVNS